MKQRKIKLTERKGQGQFSKDCGKYVADDGTIRYRRWYLGNHKTGAERLANLIAAEWKLIRLQGGAVWTADALRRIELQRAGLDAGPMAASSDAAAAETPGEAKPLMTPPPQPDPFVAGGRSLYALMDEYDQHLEGVRKAGQCSDSHRYSQQACLKRCRKYMTDVPIGSVTYGFLATFANTMAARPVTERGTPMAVPTVVNTVVGLKLFLGHLEDSGEWKPTFNWRRALRVKRSNLLTDDEREQAKAIEVFSSDDLRHIWNRSSERTRLYLLLGLNCGMTQQEIATIKLIHVHLDDAAPYIERPRNKTQVPGRWPLWSETVVLLRQYLASEGKRNPKRLAILTEANTPLVWFSDKTRNDAISSAWDRTVYDSQKWYRWRKQQAKIVGQQDDAVNPEGAPEPPQFQTLPFKHLRKTGYSWVKKRFGTEVAEWYSQHKERGVIGNYSDPCFEQVATAVQAMRAEFLPLMFQDMPSPLRPTTAEIIGAVENGTAPGPARPHPSKGEDAAGKSAAA